MTSSEARYAIFSRIEMNENVNMGESPYFEIFVSAEQALDKQIGMSPKFVHPLQFDDDGDYMCPNCQKGSVLDPYGGRPDYCHYCGQKLDWAEVKETETDWSKIEVDTPVLVKSVENENWKLRYFSRFKDGKVYTWGDGKTSTTAEYEIDWNYAKLKEKNSLPGI